MTWKKTQSTDGTNKYVPNFAQVSTSSLKVRCLTHSGPSSPKSYQWWYKRAAHSLSDSGELSMPISIKRKCPPFSINSPLFFSEINSQGIKLNTDLHAVFQDVKDGCLIHTEESPLWPWSVNTPLDSRAFLSTEILLLLPFKLPVEASELQIKLSGKPGRSWSPTKLEQ